MKPGWFSRSRHRPPSSSSQPSISFLLFQMDGILLQTSFAAHLTEGEAAFFFTCFSTAALLSSFEPEARISFRDCRLEAHKYHKILLNTSGLCFLKALYWMVLAYKIITALKFNLVMVLPCQLQPITELFHFLHHFHTVSFIVSKVIPVLLSEGKCGN